MLSAYLRVEGRDWRGKNESFELTGEIVSTDFTTRMYGGGTVTLEFVGPMRYERIVPQSMMPNVGEFYD